MLETTKHLLSIHLSPPQKSIVRLLFNTVKSPIHVKKHLNQYQYEKNVLKNPKFSHIPPVFTATITEQCNLRCPTCLYLLENENKFHSAHISIESFGEILKTANPDKLAQILFLTGGEPLLHPNIGDLIQLAREQGFSPRLSTNGILIGKKINDLSNVDYINVSLDAYDYDSFLKNRGGTPHQFDLIKEGIESLKQHKNFFSISFVLTATNVRVVDKMIQLAEELRPPSVYFHNINPHGCESFKPLLLKDMVTKKFLQDITKRTDYPFDINISCIFNPGSQHFKESRCIQPWYYFCFNHEGNIAYCCHLSHEPAIGNVFRGYDFNSAEMVQFRSNIIEGQIPKSCIYCQRRFMDSEFGNFSSHSRKWYINKLYAGNY